MFLVSFVCVINEQLNVDLTTKAESSSEAFKIEITFQKPVSEDGGKNARLIKKDFYEFFIAGNSCQKQMRKKLLLAS